ncbi:hypothetical protein NA78x_003474 [Anatilimnocola sp. NA78]|uniref:hypothetical protein n=1 Tax=Anatilimnocola sp. NA78 TaxID=3415683 RepID=UPI003CE5283E
MIRSLRLPRASQQHASLMNRYLWNKVSDSPEHYQLVDNVTHQAVATILQSDVDWSWERKTNRLLHGAPPASGKAKSVLKAKLAVLQDLPNEVSNRGTKEENRRAP